MLLAKIEQLSAGRELIGANRQDYFIYYSPFQNIAQIRSDLLTARKIDNAPGSSSTQAHTGDLQSPLGMERQALTESLGAFPGADHAYPASVKPPPTKTL